MATKKKTKGGKVGTVYGSPKPPKEGYRAVTGKNSGSTHEVKIGSTSDSNYDTAGLYQGKAADTAKFSTVNKPKEVGVISSNMGKDMVKEADRKIAGLIPESPLSSNLTPEQRMNEEAAQKIRFGTTDPMTKTDAATTEATKPETSTDTITYVNESTGQEYTLRGDALTDANKKSLEDKGYTVATSDISTAEKNPEIAALEAEVKTGQATVDTFTKSLEALLISDKDLRGDIRTITQGYNARVEQAQQITERRKQALETLGVRTGARYSGGMGGVFGGIISEEERQGLSRITEIENAKQNAIFDAKKAARDHNFSLYTKLVAIADKKQDEKIKELKTLKEAQRLQNEKLDAERKQVETEALIAGLIKDGVKDPIDIYTELAAAGKLGDYTLNDVLKIAGSLDNISYLNPKKGKAGTESEYSDVPTGGYDITEGFDFAKAKTADYKKLARQLMPGDLGNKLLVELTDEEIVEFMKDYTDAVNGAQQNINPEDFYMNWVEKSGAVKENKTAYEKKLDALKASFE